VVLVLVYPPSCVRSRSRGRSPRVRSEGVSVDLMAGCFVHAVNFVPWLEGKWRGLMEGDSRSVGHLLYFYAAGGGFRCDYSHEARDGVSVWPSP
jgi:hypothetical protein